MIDFHTHIGNMHRECYPRMFPLTVHQLVDWMDRNGIEMAVVQPLESPEGGWGYCLTEDVIAARDTYPERLIAFVCVDPRYPNAPALIDVFVKQYGCMGFGEHVNGLAFDDERNKAIYAKCDEHGLPLVFGDDLGCFDESGLPRLEVCLREFPNVIFCGHGPGFWSAISGDDPRCGYPDSRVTPGGAIDRLMAQYDNLYLDISAGSGYNAMTRDPEFARGFIERHWRKMLFGTDYLSPGQPTPIIEWLRNLDVTADVRAAIASGNARRILNLGQ